MSTDTIMTVHNLIIMDIIMHIDLMVHLLHFYPLILITSNLNTRKCVLCIYTAYLVVFVLTEFQLKSENIHNFM